MNDGKLEAALMAWNTQVFRHTMHDFTRYSRAVGLSLGQMNVLIHLYFKGPREVMDLTELMQVSPAAASQMVERMVQLGVVRRIETPEDRRVRLVQLTEEGAHAVQACMAARQNWLTELASQLSPAEQEQCASALAILLERAKQIETELPAAVLL